MATLIKENGSQYEVEPQDKEKGFTLEEVYNLLGCDYIQSAGYFKNRLMLIDEEGKLSTDWRQHINTKATIMYNNMLGYNPDSKDEPEYIVGNVLLCNDKEFQ